MSLTTRPPRITAAAAPDPDDRYTATLDQIDRAVTELRARLDSARTAPRRRRTRALNDLHQRVRGMGLLLNEALGGWPPPPAPDEAP